MLIIVIFLGKFLFVEVIGFELGLGLKCDDLYEGLGVGFIGGYFFWVGFSGDVYIVLVFC